VEITVGSAVVPLITTGPPAGCATWCVDLSTTTPGVQFDWSFGDGATGQGTNVTHCYTDAGLFDVSLTVTDAAGCTGVGLLADAISVFPVPVASYVQSPTVALVSDPTFTFTASGAADASYAWSFGDPGGATALGQGTTFTYPGAGCYPVSLLVTSADGCVNSTEGEACVEDEFALYVPNTFSPNGDGINDAFGVVTSVRAPKDYVLRVFDRWGQELWTGVELSSVWSGDAVPQGVYAWTLELRDATGTQRRARGHVVLLR
jgi:gliding motility-associated-like protein